MINKLTNEFKNIFKEEPKIYFSPGRLNLIGEHIDYNGGLVMPAAISYGTYGAASKRDDDYIYIYSEGFNKEVSKFKITDFNKNNNWLDYIKGVFFVLNKNNHKISNGINLYINSDLPNGAGLSSSSSLELLLLVILNDFYKLNIDKETLANYGRLVENEFIGVSSGIMDQFSIVNGKKDHAILLNTHTLDFNYIPIKLNEYELIIGNTNKKRTLADSKYNERYNECMSALKILKKDYNVNNLAELKEEELNNIKKLLSETLYKRVKHVITEQQRVLDSVKFLKDNDIKSFSNLLTKSHLSLKEDYDVTGKELDTLVREVLNGGALGARMTGAGFGGCMIAIVKKDETDKIIKEAVLNYEKIIGYKPDFYKVNISNGTSKI